MSLNFFVKILIPSTSWFFFFFAKKKKAACHPRRHGSPSRSDRVTVRGAFFIKTLLQCYMHFQPTVSRSQSLSAARAGKQQIKLLPLEIDLSQSKENFSNVSRGPEATAQCVERHDGKECRVDDA